MRPKVLMFGWEFPPHNSGGLGTACLGLTRALSKKAVDVLFVLPKRIQVSDDNARMLFADDDHVTIETIETIITPYITEEKYQYDKKSLTRMNKFYAGSLLEEVTRYAKRARLIAKRESFDIIHAHDWLSFLAGVEAKRVSGKPLVLHVHATEFDRTGGQGVNQAVYDIEREAMQHADQIITVSNLTKNTVLAHYGVSEDKIQVVHNGIEYSERYTAHVPDFDALKASGQKIVLFLGRITIQKGPDYFIAAAKKVLEYDKNVTFVVVGTGDMHTKMMHHVAAAGISDHVLFAGAVFGADAMKMFAAADLYIMPSVSEPFGLTPLESIINGTPVIISKQSGVSEVLTHAFKVDFWDVDEIANKIVNLLEFPSLSNTMVTNAKKEVKGINWDKAAQKCVNIYSDVLCRIKPNKGAVH